MISLGLKNLFKEAAPHPLSEAEKALKDWGVKYKKQADGSLLVPGNLDISCRGLTSLPDLRRVKVRGDFCCSNNDLTSLEGAPQTVGGDFRCVYNRLTTLVGAPEIVGGYFFCNGNQLTSLKGAPQFVGSDFWCQNNQLTSLEHAPRSLGGGFYCHDNQLASLKGVPRFVRGDLWCFNNPLASLEHAPQSFKNMDSDFGEFSSWGSIPEKFRQAPRPEETTAGRSQSYSM